MCANSRSSYQFDLSFSLLCVCYAPGITPQDSRVEGCHRVAFGPSLKLAFDQAAGPTSEHFLSSRGKGLNKRDEGGLERSVDELFSLLEQTVRRHQIDWPTSMPFSCDT